MQNTKFRFLLYKKRIDKKRIDKKRIDKKRIDKKKNISYYIKYIINIIT
jgi:hypothetical protein